MYLSIVHATCLAGIPLASADPIVIRSLDSLSHSGHSYSDDTDDGKT